MRNRFVKLLFTAAMFSIALSGFGQAAQPKGSATDAPDLAGIWGDPPKAEDRNPLWFTREEPSMLPWAAAKYKEVRKGMRGFDQARTDMGRAELDPSRYPYCMPDGFPRSYSYPEDIEIVQGPGRVYVLFSSGEIQRIYTDGRSHPKGPPLTFMGQSIGRWEGDTLVVVTKDLNDLTWIDSVGHPHTDALQVEQRIRRVDHDTMEMNFIFNDPKTYTQPWKGRKVYALLKGQKNAMMDSFLCEDRMREDFMKNVLGKKD